MNNQNENKKRERERKKKKYDLLNLIAEHISCFQFKIRRVINVRGLGNLN